MIAVRFKTSFNGNTFACFNHRELVEWAAQRGVKIGFWRDYWPIHQVGRDADREMISQLFADENRIMEFLQQSLSLLSINTSGYFPLDELLNWAKSYGFDFPEAEKVSKWVTRINALYGPNSMSATWGFVSWEREEVCPSVILARLGRFSAGFSPKRFFSLARRNELWMKTVERRLARLKGERKEEGLDPYRYVISTIVTVGNARAFFGPPEGTKVTVSRPYTGRQNTELTLVWQGKTYTAYDEFSGMKGLVPWWKGFVFGEEIEGVVVAQGFTYINMLGQREVIPPQIRIPLTLGHESEPVILNKGEVNKE